MADIAKVLVAYGIPKEVAEAIDSEDDGVLRAQVNSVTGGIVLSAGGQSIVPMQSHPNLWCDLSATNLCSDSPLVWDVSGNDRHAARGASLSVAQLNTTAGGYFSTLKGTGTGTALDTILHLPSINLDYDAGEAVLIVAAFKMAAPAADETLFGNSSSSALNGFRVRARSSGYCDIAMYSTTGGVSSFSGNSNTILLDGTLHQFAILIDGKSKTRTFWEDGVLTRERVAALANCDTRESSGFHIAGSQLAPSSAGNTSAASFRRFTVMRWASNEALPELDDMTRLIKRLRSDMANPPRVFEI